MTPFPCRLGRPTSVTLGWAIALSLHAMALGQGNPPMVPVPTTGTSVAVAPTSEPGTADSEAVRTYRQHVTTLSGAFFEGRAPGTQGNRRAADYVEYYFRTFGLQPAFPAAPSENPVPAAQRVQYRQVFEAPASLRPGDSTKLKAQQIEYTAKDAGGTVLKDGVDFNTLGYSGSGKVSADLAFVGYALSSDTHKYRSIPDGTSLKGKVAMLLRFEPMDDSGKSLWGKDGEWSFAAALEPKLRAVADAGAEAIILVNTPGASDPRAKELGDLALAGRRPLKVPVVMMTSQAADALVKAADPQHRSLMDLRRTADTLAEGKSGVIDLPNAAVDVNVDLERVPLMTDNVGAVLPGAGNLADQFIVLGAHYDHLGYGYFGSRADDPRGRIHFGADDNASGTSGLLLVAQHLAKAYAALPNDQPRRSVLFLAFSSEESGLVGSRFYTKHMIVPHDAHDIMINMDMIGRLRDDKVELQGVGTAEGLEDWIKPYLDASGLKISPKKGGSGPSDHASFYGAQIPVLFFFTGLHTQYHTPDDTYDLINCEGAVRVTDLVERLAIDLARLPQPWKFVGPGAAGPEEQGQARGGVKVRFGIAPGDYSGDEKGVSVGQVFPGTPADKAGLKPGDMLTNWNGKPLTDVESWMPLLKEHQPGDRVIIHFRRKVGDSWQDMSADVELTARSTEKQ